MDATLEQRRDLMEVFDIFTKICGVETATQILRELTYEKIHEAKDPSHIESIENNLLLQEYTSECL